MLCTSFPSALPPFSIIAGWDHSQAKNLQNPAGRPWGQVGSGVTQAGQRWLAPVADTESENPRFLLRAFPNRPLLPRGGVTASRLSRGPVSCAPCSSTPASSVPWLQSLPLQTEREAFGELRGPQVVSGGSQVSPERARHARVLPQACVYGHIFLGSGAVAFIRLSEVQNPDNGLQKHETTASKQKPVRALKSSNT